MSISAKNYGVVRDPGTIFLSWDAKIKENSNISKDAAWTIVITNTDTGEEISIAVDPKAGKYYIHNLQPETYYHIVLCVCEENGERTNVSSFGTLKTFPSSVSDKTDTVAAWRTDKDSLLNLTGSLWDPLGSSYGK